MPSVETSVAGQASTDRAERYVVHPAPSVTRCQVHPGSFVRRRLAVGPRGPGIYRECTPRIGEPPHLLDVTGVETIVVGRAQTSRLTPSELDVLEDAANGLSVRESGLLRRKGVETVKSQRGSVLRKLGARTMTHAVALSLQNGVEASDR
jgi:DNA-binding CsgD family transcriptional regulator